MMLPSGSDGGMPTGPARAEAYDSEMRNQTPPLQDAVNNAFDESNAASTLDPNLIAHITREVVSSLKAAGLTGAHTNKTPTPSTAQPAQAPAPPSQYAPPPLHHPAPTHTHYHNERSPTSATSSVPPRYTPPSPNRHDISSNGSSSPEPQTSETDSHSSRRAHRTRGRTNTQTSPPRHEDVTGRTRPRPVRIPTAIEETTLEKIWKPLFDNGRPTPRLGQFLRGLANHIILDCEPRNSIVITPAKMYNFFEATKIADEIYPWKAIFGGRLTNASISKLYRDLMCQHHFIQHNTHDIPNIPSLTQHGFEKFMTALIQAHPHQEYERLARAVLDMPISNADDTRERFPKELSRRLFPTHEDIQQQQRVTAALSADPAIQLRGSNPMPPPPASQPPPNSQPAPTSQSFPIGAFAERQRNPYASSTFSSAFDDDELRNPNNPPIERERKPYTARGGSGKVYEDDRTNNAARADPPARQVRANSAIPVQPPFSQQSRATEIPANRAHRMSMNGGPTPRFGTSPAVQNPYTRSEGTNVGDVPSQFYASNIHEAFEEPRRPTRRPTDDGYGASPRTVYDCPQPASYDPRRAGGTDGYGSFTPGNNYAPPTQQMPRH